MEKSEIDWQKLLIKWQQIKVGLLGMKEIAPDHVHLLVEYDNNHSITDVARAFKGRSSRYLRQEFPELLKLPSLLSRSYFYETTGKISTAKIKAYIEDPHHY